MEGEEVQLTTATASGMALAASRLGNEAQMLAAELRSLGTVLQNMSTLCHHASRFPENPGLRVWKGWQVQELQSLHYMDAAQRAIVFTDGTGKQQGHQGWDGSLECFVAEPLGADPGKGCAGPIAQSPGVLSSSS